MRITSLICTHNRLPLLKRAIESIDRAERLPSVDVDIFVVANSCSDVTVEWLRNYRRSTNEYGASLPLNWVEEPKLGKARALNRAVGFLTADLVAFVDDDQIVDRQFFVEAEKAARRFSDFDLFCGRVLPDWDGTEPEWVHDDGPFRIYPLPVPSHDRGMAPLEIGLGDRLPGGGAVFLRRKLFDRIGSFNTNLGPKGHDLGGGEDQDFLLRALRSGVRLMYVPTVLQYHGVENARFDLSYILRKSYLRSQAATRMKLHTRSRPPLYLWRKLLIYMWHSAISLALDKKRFYLVRVAATLGEISAHFFKQDSP